jgi:type I restriction enzyme R subunit
VSTTDTSERGLETLITESLINDAGYKPGSPADYDRARCVDTAHCFAFLSETQPQTLARLTARHGAHLEKKLLDRIAEQVRERGVVDVLRRGIKDGPEEVILYYPQPASIHNPLAAARYATNRFSVTRQLRYSDNERQRALDLTIFINGLPLATFELKNRLTKQNVKDAIRQYQEDRDPHEPLFVFGRCLVHFAMDDELVYMATHLQGERTGFLPFNQGHNEGAGNPPNPEGTKTDYLWKRILARDSLADILEKYAQLVVETDHEGRKRKKLVFPRYHQLDLVRRLLADIRAIGAGRRYLIQHSAGSGKSNSIAWLAHQLVELTDPAGERPIFDSVVVVTDRTILDKQIRDTIKQFAHVAGVVQPITEGSGQLRNALEDGKKIVVTTIQKFPYIVKEIKALGDKRFAIIIDEAHSSQSGQAAATMNVSLGRNDDDEVETLEDQINRIIEEQRLLANASYFAFTATPKGKTLETFGWRSTEDGKFYPFHTYSMKQAIEEEFIVDVLQNYTTYASYYKLFKRIEDDPKFDTIRAQKKLRKYVEQHPDAIERKTRIMVDHFLSEVILRRKVNGRARAMIVTGSILAAIRYKLAFDAYLREIKSPFKAIVAFTGEKEDGGQTYSEQRMNGFASADIPDEFEKDDYRFLIVAEKFQTGFDQPLLHTMYVDKVLSDVKAVQTLSRLNRAYKPWKIDTFVLDFVNTADQIQRAFEPFYRTTILSEETDLNRLNDLADALDGFQVYSRQDVDELMARYLASASRDQLDPTLDRCAETYSKALTADEQIDFKAKAKAFVRTYQFLVMIQNFNKPYWESLKTFLKLLLTKLPAPDDEDLSKGVLESVDMDSYRAEQQATLAIHLAGGQELDPTPADPRAGKYDATFDLLSNIIHDFNERYSTDWTDSDRIRRFLFEELPQEVSRDQEYRNAKLYSDRQNARITHEKKLVDKFQEVMLSHTELYRKFTDDPDFKQWLCETLFRMDYDRAQAQG